MHGITNQCKYVQLVYDNKNTLSRHLLALLYSYYCVVCIQHKIDNASDAFEQTEVVFE